MPPFLGYCNNSTAKGEVNTGKIKFKTNSLPRRKIWENQDQKLTAGGRRVRAEARGGGQGHFNPGHTSKVRKLLCSSGNNSLSGKLGDFSCSSTYCPEKRRSLFSCMSRVSRAEPYFY